MLKLFIKNSQICSFKVDGNKVFTTITLGNFTIINPTLKLFLSAGWKEYIPEIMEQEQYLPTIEELVERKIRERYSVNQEFEVQRKRDVEPEAFQTYYDYVEECISWANEQPHRESQESESR